MTTDALLFDSPLARVTLERNGRLVRITRTAARFTADGLATLAPLATDILPRTQRAERALLLDVRAAPLLGDDEMERRVGASTVALFDGFGRIAVLVATAWVASR